MTLFPMSWATAPRTHFMRPTGAMQPTVNGLLVWSKAENTTVFWNGVRIWVNGPYGVQNRAVDGRIPWETDVASRPLTTGPTPVPVARVPVYSPAPSPREDVAGPALVARCEEWSWIRFRLEEQRNNKTPTWIPYDLQRACIANGGPNGL